MKKQIKVSIGKNKVKGFEGQDEATTLQLRHCIPLTVSENRAKTDSISLFCKYFQPNTIGSPYWYSTDNKTPCLIHNWCNSYIPHFPYTALITRTGPGPLLYTDKEPQYVNIMRLKECTDDETPLHQ